VGGFPFIAQSPPQLPPDGDIGAGEAMPRIETPRMMCGMTVATTSWPPAMPQLATLP
jgi:hypothetical protein